MPFESASSWVGLKYYGDRSKRGNRVVHEVASRTPECRLDDIKHGVKFLPDRLGQAHRYHYENCQHCLNPRQMKPKRIL